ncbi:hypothetical protein E8E12_004542 [Didymella heteroderae]|uniref:Uncharacterized protein n=1 Tax=Didymella heteroderae TaxID=1769908 RepID=A0A9P5C0S5_9PLEO|nr:hypothetical protein E8E12_004542 [Didymella heteroderae]
MRSFKSKVLSAVAFAAAGFAAALPSHGEVARPRNEPLLLDVQQNYAQATFSVPCTGCSGQAHTDQDDESLILNFTAHSHDEACGSSNITINGVPLPQEWEGDYASGSGSYQYTSLATLQQNDQLPQRDLALAWNSTCLHGNAETDEAAQILTVNIKSIDGVPINTPSGFTISFKQNASPPTLLRLETIPDLAPELSDIWRDPPAHLRLVFGNATAAETNRTNVSLEDEIRELRALQAELAAIQQAVASKKQYINSQIRKEAKCFTEELKHCNSISCVLKTVADKAHGAWRVVYLRLHPDDQSKDMGRPEEIYASAHVSSQRYGSINVANTDAEAEAEDSSEPRPYEESTGELPPRPQQRQAPYIIALEIALGVLCCGCLFAVVRHKCSSLRTRTERAADYEERYNARIFKRAARRHAWRNWWRGNWRKDAARIADYEEKRALIADQENVLETAMQEEIRQLRVAHNVVNDIIRAEEGRTGTPNPTNPHCTCRRPHFAPGPPSVTSTYPPSTIPEAPSRPLSRTDSLPSYRSRAPSEPPTYDSDLDSSFVANGLQYEARPRAYTSTSSQAGESGRWTPDSSVVDVSPRPSAETLRHPQSIFTLDESESEDEV